MIETELTAAVSQLAIAILLGSAAISSGIGIGMLASKMIEGAARQPEQADSLQMRALVMAGLLDAVPIIAVGIGLMMLFANPLTS